MKTTIVVSLLLLAIGCAKDSSSSPPPSPKINKGQKLKPVDAEAILLETKHWCYANTENDAFFAMQTFHKGDTADYYACRRAGNHCDAPMAMKWSIADDVLTMILPKKFQFEAMMRFLDGTVQLWEDEDTLKTVLISCSQ